jgi:glucose-1-phosphate thymidylyltransferase
MKGIILAGGTGSRLLPVTKTVNKSLLPVGGKPMICYPLELLKNAGITDIMVVSGSEHCGDIMRLLGSGKEWGCELTYRVQDEANGIAAALRLCETFCEREPFAVVLGDNIFVPGTDVSASIREFGEGGDDDYRLFVRRVPDPERFGVPVYDEEGNLVDVVEKPPVAPSDQAILGAYCYTTGVFGIASFLKPSARGEYEISDVNRTLVKDYVGKAVEVMSEWIDAGTHDSYRKANELVWRAAR